MKVFFMLRFIKKVSGIVGLYPTVAGDRLLTILWSNLEGVILNKGVKK